MIRLIRIWWLRRAYQRAVVEYADYCALPTGVWRQPIARALHRNLIDIERRLSAAINPPRSF